MNRNFFRSLDLSMTPDAQSVFYALFWLALVLMVMLVLCLAYCAIEYRINVRRMYAELDKTLGPNPRDHLS